jgi:hypothetical protein
LAEKKSDTSFFFLIAPGRLKQELFARLYRVASE